MGDEPDELDETVHIRPRRWQWTTALIVLARYRQAKAEARAAAWESLTIELGGIYNRIADEQRRADVGFELEQLADE